MQDRMPMETSMNWKENYKKPGSRGNFARKNLIVATVKDDEINPVSDEINKLKNFNVPNVGPGVSPLGCDTFKILKANG